MTFSVLGLYGDCQAGRCGGGADSFRSPFRWVARRNLECILEFERRALENIRSPRVQKSGGEFEIPKVYRLGITNWETFFYFRRGGGRAGRQLTVT